jgi:hypothetical protein
VIINKNSKFQHIFIETALKGNENIRTRGHKNMRKLEHYQKRRHEGLGFEVLRT